MAYRHFNDAPYLQCWCDGSHTCVRELDGKVNFYGCALGVKMQSQVIPFYEPDAIWCLRHDGILRVGRNDSTFSDFKETDDLLVRCGTWESPFRHMFDIVGQWCGYSTVLGSDDGRMVYAHDARGGYVPDKIPHQDSVLTLVAGNAIENINDLSICTREGWPDVRGAGVWANAPELP